MLLMGLNIEQYDDLDYLVVLATHASHLCLIHPNMSRNGLTK